MEKIKESIGEGLAVFLGLGYIISPWFGLYAAVVGGSFLNALLSLMIPWYGLLYWVLS